MSKSEMLARCWLRLYSLLHSLSSISPGINAPRNWTSLHVGWLRSSKRALIRFSYPIFAVPNVVVKWTEHQRYNPGQTYSPGRCGSARGKWNDFVVGMSFDDYATVPVQWRPIGIVERLSCLDRCIKNRVCFVILNETRLKPWAFRTAINQSLCVRIWSEIIATASLGNGDNSRSGEHIKQRVVYWIADSTAESIAPISAWLTTWTNYLPRRHERHERSPV